MIHRTNPRTAATPTVFTGDDIARVRHWRKVSPSGVLWQMEEERSARRDWLADASPKLFDALGADPDYYKNPYDLVPGEDY